MKKKIRLSLIVVALLCIAGWNSYGQRSTPRTIYQYRVVLDPGNMDAETKALNDLGLAGWELVGIKPVEKSGATFYFRRSLP